MINRTVSFDTLWRFLLPFALLSLLLSLSSILMVQEHIELMSLAITIDFLFVLPLCFFWLNRNSDQKWLLAPFTAFCLWLANSIIPLQHQGFLQLIQLVVFPLIELGVLFFVGLKVYQAFKVFDKYEDKDFYNLCVQAFSDIFPPRVAPLFATELSMFYYGFAVWKAPELPANAYSYHRKTHSQFLCFCFVGLIPLEMVVVHILVHDYSPLLAWILAGLSLYGMMQLLAIGKSMAHRPIIVLEDQLQLRYGFLSSANIPLELIQSVELAFRMTGEQAKESGITPLGLAVDIEPPNILLQLSREIELNRLYGFKIKTKKIAFFIDDPEKFLENAKNKIKDNLEK